MTTYTTKQGDVVDEICHRYYGQTSGAAEAVLEANRGLADYGPKLPSGLVIMLPDMEPVSQETKLVRLWD